MSDPPPTLARPLSLIALAVIVGLGFWWWLEDDSERARSNAEVATDAAPSASFREPEVYDPGPDVPHRPATRTEARAEARAEIEEAPPGAYDPPIPTLGVEEPMHEVDPDAPPVQPPPSRNTGPTTAEQELGRAVFWRGMLDGRVTELNEQLAWAIEHEDAATEARARRMLDRLEAQRPSVDQRIEELEERASVTPAPDER